MEIPYANRFHVEAKCGPVMGVPGRSRAIMTWMRHGGKEGCASPSGNSEAHLLRVTVAVGGAVMSGNNRSLHSSSYKKADAGTRVGGDIRRTDCYLVES